MTLSSLNVDVVIVGAGPAGSAAAYDLALAGLRVAIVDRKTFPRDKPCGGGLTHKSVDALRYPLDSLIRSKPSILSMTKKLKKAAAIDTGGAFLTMVTRLEFDNHALQKAISVGALFITVPKTIQKIINNHDQSSMEWDNLRIQTRWIIAADGANSQIRRITQPGYRPAQAFALESLVSGTSLKLETSLDFGVVKGGYGWVLPKGDHLNIGLYTANGYPPPSRDALQKYVAEKAPGGKITQTLGGVIPTHCYLSTSQLGRILYVGDAAGFSDNLFGEGIYGAIVSGQIAAEFIVAGTQSNVGYENNLTTLKSRYQHMNVLASALYLFMPVTYPLFHWHMNQLCKQEGLKRKG